MNDPAPRCNWIQPLLLLIFLYVQPTYARQAQAVDSLLQQQMLLYAQAHPEGQLFVHTDKIIYTNNETIWFSAYLLRSASVEMSLYNFLSVVLVQEHTRKIEVQQKYVMDNGIANGSILLPDTIPPGDYRLVVYSNVLDSSSYPVACFVQPLTIKSITQRSFYTNLQLLDSLPDQDGTVRARLSWVLKPSATPAPKARSIVEYSIGKFDSKPKKVDSNSYIIAVNKEQLQQSNPVLNVAVKHHNETQYMSLQLPGHARDSCQLRFFPEGGYLVDGLVSVIGWEARSSDNIPLPVTAVLYKNGQAIDTIKTSRQGMGKFRLMPAKDNSYTVKVLSADYSTAKEWRLPEVLEQGVVMEMKEAVVNDSLRVHFFSKEEQNLRVIIHNYRTVFLSFGIKTDPNGMRVVVPLQEVPKGVATITVLDHNNQPIAERLFFAWHEKRQQELITTDKAQYEKREKATVTVKLKDLSGNPLKGLVSIAVVQDNRIEYNKEQDIATYCYLISELGPLQKPAAGRILDDKDHLEELLLIKGWRRFTWQAIQQAKAIDKQQVHSPAFTAQVTVNDRIPKRSLKVTLMRDGQIDIDSTDMQGKLTIDPSKLVVQENKKIHLFVNEKNAPVYSIEENDPFLSVNKRMAEMDWHPLPGRRKKQANSREQELEGFQQARVLQQVVVTANNDQKLYGANGANACGDFVCLNNILNCKGHVGDASNRPPVKGHSYYNYHRTHVTIYTGCVIEEDKKRLKGICLAREFYGVNTDSATAAEPKFLSTLYWEPASLLDEQGVKTISFYTGDITDRFRIIVQGISNRELIVAEKKFSVR